MLIFKLLNAFMLSFFSINQKRKKIKQILIKLKFMNKKSIKNLVCIRGKKHSFFADIIYWISSTSLHSVNFSEFFFN